MLAHKMNTGYKAWRALKCVTINTGFCVNAKIFLYAGVIVWDHYMMQLFVASYNGVHYAIVHFARVH